MRDSSDDAGRFGELSRDSLADTLARRIHEMIQSGDYTEGDRLPAILDLVDARIPIEVAAIRVAVARASDGEIDSMRHLLDDVAGSVDERRLVAADVAFHRQLAAASGNAIVAQLLDALRDLFTGEGRTGWWEPLLCDADVAAHVRILDAIERRDANEAAELMRAHLTSVRDAVTADRRPHPTATQAAAGGLGYRHSESAIDEARNRDRPLRGISLSGRGKTKETQNAQKSAEVQRVLRLLAVKACGSRSRSTGMIANPQGKLRSE